ncbi:MAG: ABC transporter substrate-binding protein [Pseudomonadota bacterium]
MSDLSFRGLTAAISAVLITAFPAWAVTPVEPPFFAEEVASGALPPISERLPATPLIVDLEAKGRATGISGGTLKTMVGRDKDVRQMIVYGYARLVGYDESFEIQPDILESIENVDNKVYTLNLRPGHKWSDGVPLTSADFQYWWEDVANNELLSPSGPPDFLRVNGKFPEVTFPDEHTIVYTWEDPNPAFLGRLAQAIPPFIYRPKHYVSQFHADYVTPEDLEQIVDENRLRSWAALHNKIDNMHRFDNPDLPTLQPWVNVDDGKQTRHFFDRNPYFHRLDNTGQQLPYIDVVEMTVVSPGLVAAKSNAGESDLQGRGLDFRDIAILRKGEADGSNYRTFLWGNGYASQVAIYPNLNYNDDVWRSVLRDVRVRRALSLGIDRNSINQALYFKLAKPGSMTVLPQSPFFEQANRDAWSAHDVDLANALLDEAGLAERQGNGIRLLPDGRPMQIVVETAGERQEVENALQIIIDDWRDIGVELIMRPLDRDILYNRVFAGTTMASVWYGWDNGLPQANSTPSYLCPRRQEFLSWPKWGQFYQTNGAAGEPVDMEPASRLMELCDAWEAATTDEDRGAAWTEMLKIHAENLYAIGLLAEAPQPIVVNKSLRNVPEEAIWSWEPGAHFGIYRPDEFYFASGE